MLKGELSETTESIVEKSMSAIIKIVHEFMIGKKTIADIENELLKLNYPLDVAAGTAEMIQSIALVINECFTKADVEHAFSAFFNKEKLTLN